MDRYVEKARQLRAIEQPHVNCAQSVLLAFAEGAGLSPQQAFDLAQGFGGGMRIGATCGAVTGGIMVLGLYHCADAATVADLFSRVKAARGGLTDCRDLLKAARERGQVKQEHCDGMVFLCVALVHDILREKGVLE